MKNVLLFSTLIFCLLLFSCQQEEVASEFTGRSVTYPMISGAYFDHSTTGTVRIKERIDGSVQVAIFMQGTMEGASHPVHLHRGSLQQDKAVALYLSPLEDISNSQSQSITHLSLLEDTPVNFDYFLQLDASIKIHFQETGELKNVILGATSIGKNYQANDLTRLDQDIIICNNF